jgi:hypothetical protein
MEQATVLELVEIFQACKNLGLTAKVLLPSGVEVLVSTEPESPQRLSEAGKVNGNAFFPTPTQKAILKALDGKAMNSTQLGNVIGNKSQVYQKPGGIDELIKNEKVKHTRRLGYFRPDALPPELEGGEVDKPFVPDIIQKEILKALDGKAMRTTKLGEIVGDVSRLYKPRSRGIKELERRGLVAYHSNLGYYRPDRPPKELSEVLLSDQSAS